MKKGKRDAGFGKRKGWIIAGLALCVVLLAVSCILVTKIIKNLQKDPAADPAAEALQNADDQTQDPGTAVIDTSAILRGHQLVGVDLDGLTLAQAEAAVTQALADFDDTLTVKLPDRSLRFSQVCSWSFEDLPGLLQTIYDAGGVPAELGLITDLDRDAVDKIIQAAAKDVNCDPEDPTYKVSDDTLVLTLGVTGKDLDADALLAAVERAYQAMDMTQLDWDYTLTEAAPLDLEAIHESLSAEMKDAAWDPELGVVTAETVGYSFDLSDAQKAVDAALEEEDAKTVTVALEVTQPELTQEYLESVIFRDLLGSTDASQSSSYNRANNMNLACQAINGTVLQPGDVFSFNDVVGQRTPEKGYLMAGAYSNGEVVQEVGGGVCQVASSVYYSALKANLEIVNRTCHMFAASYVPLGMDATVSWGSPNFEFRNSTDFPIRIDASADGGTVHIQLYGTNLEGTYVEMTATTTDVYPWETVYKLDETLGAGNQSVTTTAATGYRVVSYRNVYAADGTLLSSAQEAVSNYQRRNQVISLGSLEPGTMIDEKGYLVPDPDYVPEPEPEPEPQTPETPSEPEAPAGTDLPAPTDPAESTTPETPAEEPAAPAEEPADSAQTGDAADAAQEPAQDPAGAGEDTTESGFDVTFD